MKVKLALCQIAFLAVQPIECRASIMEREHIRKVKSVLCQEASLAVQHIECRARSNQGA